MMVNIPIWEQCKSEYLLKCKQHFESKPATEEEEEQLSQIDLVLKEREQAKPEKGE